MTIFALILLIVTAMAYACLIATLLTLHNSDAAGNGLSQAFGALVTVVLWILLSGLMIVAGSKGSMPPWTSAIALFLVPASGAAALAAGQLLGSTFYRAKWPLVVPILLPLLLVGFALWAYLPLFQAILSPAMAGAWTWGAVLVLSLLPWPQVIYRSRYGAAEQAKAQAEWEAAAPQRAEEERQRNLAAFRQLTPASSFADWQHFFNRDNELRVEALTAFRQLPERQSQIDSHLQRGYDHLIDDLQDFDPQPTSVVCDAARRHLKQKVADLTPRNPADPPDFAYMLDRIEPSLPAIQWLVAHQTGCDAELDAIEIAVRLYPDSAVRRQFLNAFAAARQSLTAFPPAEAREN
jgi:hypothetical protein